MADKAYYNEIDPKAAATLRQLIVAGLIAPGDVDERSIEDVKPSELFGYTQCHFFAGFGVWSYALRRAGWPDSRRIWTGSCPCQPFSAAGKAGGFADERHLWPAFEYLIRQCRPDTVVGEQVASKDGLAWLDLVQADLEAAHYAAGAVDLCAAGVGAPHIRQRLYFAAVRLDDAVRSRLEGHGRDECHFDEPGRIVAGAAGSAAEASPAHGLADADGIEQRVPGDTRSEDREGGTPGADADGRSLSGGLADADGARRRQVPRSALGDEATDGVRSDSHHVVAGDGEDSRPGPTNGFWRDVDWLHCRDEKWRPVQPGTFPLVDGAPARVGRLRGYGNAINAEVAKAFIESLM
jgi:DNA (cytosine-5)-methyltransferase 1